MAETTIVIDPRDLDDDTRLSFLTGARRGLPMVGSAAIEECRARLLAARMALAGAAWRRHAQHEIETGGRPQWPTTPIRG